MRKALLLLPGCLLVLCFPAAAQDFPKYEFSGGYAFSRLNGFNWHGWVADGARNLNSYLGLVVDVSNPRSTDNQIVLDNSLETKRNTFAFLAGPRLTARGPYKLIPFGHLLLGAAVNKYHSVQNVAGMSYEYDDTATQFAGAFGGGIDYKVKGRMSLRGQFDYLFFRVSYPGYSYSYYEKGLRLSGGVRFSLGDIKQ